MIVISLKDTIALGGSLVQPRPVNKNERGQKQPLIILYTLPFKSWGKKYFMLRKLGFICSKIQ